MRRTVVLALVSWLAVAGCGSSSQASNSPAPSGVSQAVLQACQPSKSAKIAEIKNRGTINWGIGFFAPYGYKDTNGNWVGIEPDNAKEFASILGVKVSFQQFDYGLLPPALVSNKVDIVGAGLVVTPQRQQVIDFSTSYASNGVVFYVLKSRNDLSSIADLNKSSIKFVYGTGDVEGQIAKQIIPNAQINAAPRGSSSLLYNFLVNGSADATMGDGFALPLFMKKYPNPPLKAIGNNGVVSGVIPTSSDMINVSPIAFGIAKGDQGFETCVNTWVKDLNDTGREQKRLETWLSSDYPV